MSFDWFKRMFRRDAPKASPPVQEPQNNVVPIEEPEWLQGPHGGVRWQETPGGVLVEGEGAPMRTPGPPATARRVIDWFWPEIEKASLETGVPTALIIATICAESAGGVKVRETAVRARRQEPGYVSEERTPSRVSIGVMQTLISTARQAMGRPSLQGHDLLDPYTSILAGTRYILQQSKTTGFHPPLVAAAYNAGGLYKEDLRGNRWKLRCYPSGTGEHIDRFCRFWGDAIVALKERKGL